MKEFHMLNEHHTALNRFISRFTDKCKSFFQALKKNRAHFCRNEECRTAFQGMKKYLVSPPIVETFLGRDIISLSRRLRVSGKRSLGLEDEGAQKPMYHVSHPMNDPQTRYQRLEKLVLALFIISRKFKHYFQIFPITVLTEYPLRSIVENLEATRRITKWASELRSYTDSNTRQG